MLPLDPYFLNVAGVLAFLSLIPFLLIYLIKPKPKDKIISSLMFILKSEGRFSKNSFLRYLLRNLLFLMQLLTILLLSAAIARPYINRSGTVSTQDVVLVMDASASMQTEQGGKTRFEKAKTLAKSYFGERTSIVIAGASPELIIKNKGRGEAEATLNRLKAYDTPGDLTDAIRFAGEQLDGTGKVVVFSDFILPAGNDLEVAKSVLASRGIATEFIPVGGQAENVGIIDLDPGDTSVVYVKNFNDQPKTITLSVGDTNSQLQLAAHASQSFAFATPPGLTTISIDGKDDFPVDDKVYLSAPQKQDTSVLIIGNSRDSFLEAAFRADPKVKLTTAEPPLVPDIKQDVIVLDYIQKDLLLKETVRDIGRAVDNGAVLIILAHENLKDLDMLSDLLPVDLGDASTTAGTPIVTPVSYTQDIDFGTVTGYYPGTPHEGATSIADIAGKSVVAISKRGAGNIVYYGIDDQKADFKSTPSYPIFWHGLVSAMLGRESLAQLNFKTGTTLGDQRLDKAGFHKIGNTDIAANLIDETESAVNAPGAEGSVSEGQGGQTQNVTQPWPFDHILLWIAIPLLLLEFLYIKRRGDF